MKLVRHRLPGIAAARDKPMRTTTVTDPDELRALLAEKLVEEAMEFRAEPSIDELADTYEALQCLLKLHGWSMKLLEGRWAHLRRERGGLLDGVDCGVGYVGDPVKPGDRVTVMVEHQPARAVVVHTEQDPQNLSGFRWHTTPVAGGRSGSEEYGTEGLAWARGWSEEAAGALAAAYALSEPVP